MGGSVNLPASGGENHLVNDPTGFELNTCPNPAYFFGEGNDHMYRICAAGCERSDNGSVFGINVGGDPGRDGRFPDRRGGTATDDDRGMIWFTTPECRRSQARFD
ncbi:MAG: hypothetical protein IPP17_30620 [Bacteroidetes bacterium]|nr:hypothetical protein [Bacteroidota bacterium]